MKRPVMAPAVLLSALATAGALTHSAAQESQSVELQVFQAERAFARSMAERSLAEFGGFVSEEAIFFGPEVLRGKRQVLEAWAAFFDGEQAPFSWAPEVVEVLPSGDLAHSSGPIFDAGGERVGTFNSVWRLEPDGRWRVVFDKGCSCLEGG